MFLFSLTEVSIHALNPLSLLKSLMLSADTTRWARSHCRERDRQRDRWRKSHSLWTKAAQRPRAFNAKRCFPKTQTFIVLFSASKCSESPCWLAGCRGWSLHWAAWPCCQGPVSNGDSWGSWTSWWRQTSQRSPPHLYNRFCSWIWSVPVLLGGHRVHCVIHPFIHTVYIFSWVMFCTCDVPQLQSDFFCLWPVQQLHWEIHWRHGYNVRDVEEEARRMGIKTAENLTLFNTSSDPERSLMSDTAASHQGAAR